jgi:hypothetical protein
MRHPFGRSRLRRNRLKKEAPFGASIFLWCGVFPAVHVHFHGFLIGRMGRSLSSHPFGHSVAQRLQRYQSVTVVSFLGWVQLGDRSGDTAAAEGRNAEGLPVRR